jgi:antitoxin (DNA-binding transcriptional repressor) of toxin-antitoxin stability system
MKRFTVAEARARFGDLLDEVDQGRAVIIQRRDLQYTLKPLATRKPRTRRASPFAWVDPAVARGEWTWDPAPTGVRFRPRQSRKRR